MQELLDLIRAGKVNCIVVKDFSRFGRNSIETGYFLERVFPLYRTRFVSMTDYYDSDAHEGGTGGIEVALKFLVHEQYSLDLSRKIKDAKAEKAPRGEYIVKNCVFGFVKTADEVDAEIDRLNRAYAVITGQITKLKRETDARAILCEAVFGESGITQSMVYALIKKVLVYPDARISIQGKIADMFD